MANIFSEYRNQDYKVNCTGQAIIIYEAETGKVQNRIRIPYVYYGFFIPDSNIFIAKSISGFLVKCDLNSSKVNKMKLNDLTQDGGFALCPWNNHLYNIEAIPNGYQISVYDVESFNKVETIPIKGDVSMVYDIEFDSRKPIWYVSLSYSYNGRIRNAIAKMSESALLEIRNIAKDEFDRVAGYKFWERCNFSNKALYISKMYSDNCCQAITLSALYEKQGNAQGE